MARSLQDIIKNEKPEVVKAAKTKAQNILLNIHLAEIRERVDKTQTQVADALGVKQPTIAGMEQEGQDIKLSTLKRYVESLGGKVNLDVELPDGTHFGFSL